MSDLGPSTRTQSISEVSYDESSDETQPETCGMGIDRSFNLRNRGEETQKPSSEMEIDSETSSEYGDDTSDMHDDNCCVCGKDSDTKNLLCCDSCPKVCHLYCIRPPLKTIPKGDWHCSSCKELLKCEKIDRIYDERPESRSAPAGYFVKFRKKSHLHCEWVPKEVVDEMTTRNIVIRKKLEYFYDNSEQNAELKALNPDDFQNGVHKDWITVEKILETENHHMKKLLVKWKGLSYDHCTWELTENLPDAELQIKEFKHQTSIRQAVRNRTKTQPKRKRPSAETEKDIFGSTPPFLSKGLELHPYQVEGLNWLKFKWDQRQNVILADEMGLGKTIQSIALLAALWNEGVCHPHLVVVPLSTLENWQREFECWAPQLKIAVISGSKEAREIVLKHEVYVSSRLRSSRTDVHSRKRKIKCNVILTSYEIASIVSSHLRRIEFACLIIDESHKLKATDSKFAHELNTVNSRFRLLLTGTPLQNNIQELFNLLHFVDDKKFDSWEQFEGDFSEISKEDQVKKLQELLSPYLLRRLKKDVLKDLPPKKEQIIRVEMTDVQRTLYKSLLENRADLLIKGHRDRRAKFSKVSLLMDLRKCCAHPYLFEGIEQRTADKERELAEMINACGKLAMLDRMLAKLKVSPKSFCHVSRFLKVNGHRVLIYSQFVIMLNILEDYLELKGHGFLRLDGSVRGQARQALIDGFNERPDKYFVFLLSTRAGGLGINLATADTVIIYDSDYNPHNDIQAQARCHRLGQKKPVMIFRLVTRPSVEERIFEIARKKLILEKIAVPKKGAAQLNQDELDSILRYGAAELFADERLAEKKAQGCNLAATEEERIRSQATKGRIVYDDETLTKILDRSDMTTAEEDKLEVDDELLEGFKIANFDVMEKAPEEKWEVLLGHRTEAQALNDGEGSEFLTERRRRKSEVTYRLEDSDSEDTQDSEYHADEQDDSETEDLEEDIEHDVTLVPHVKIQKIAKEQTAPERTTGEIVLWEGGEKLICGLNHNHRKAFSTLLLKFGCPENTVEGRKTGDWSNWCRYLPEPLRPNADTYGRIVLAVARGQQFGNIELKDVLFGIEPSALFMRIGVMHNFRKKIQNRKKNPGKLWIYPSIAASLYTTTRFWKEGQDWALVYSIVECGYGEWADCLKYGDGELEDALKKELNINIEEHTASILPTDTVSQSLEVPNGESSQETQNAVNSMIQRSVADFQLHRWLTERAARLARLIVAENEHRIYKRMSQKDRNAPSKLGNGLRNKYQAILRQCIAVRDCSNAVSNNRSYEELHAAGIQFRSQMMGLCKSARELSKAVPDECPGSKMPKTLARNEKHKVFTKPSSSMGKLYPNLGSSGSSRNIKRRKTTQTDLPGSSNTSVRLDTRLGTDPKAHRTKEKGKST